MTEPNPDRDRWTGPLVKQHFDKMLELGLVALVGRLDATDARLDRILEGFPQQYATQEALEKVRNSIETIRGDHVPRRDLDDVKKDQTKLRDDLTSEIAGTHGRRGGVSDSARILYAIVGILLTILAVVASFLIATHK